MMQVQMQMQMKESEWQVKDRRRGGQEDLGIMKMQMWVQLGEPE
jgi:hypothetical protein